MEKNNLVPAPPVSPRSRSDFFIELILIFIVTMAPLLLGSVGPFGTTLTESAAALILFLWVFKFIKQGAVDFVRTPINKFVALFLLFIALQYLFIGFFLHEFSLGEIYRQKMRKEALKLISYLVFFFFISNNIQERKKISRLISSLVCIGFTLSLFGIIQKLSGAKNMFWISDVPAAGGFASFPNRNHFANYINMVIFLTLGVIFSRFPVLRDELRSLGRKGLLQMIFSTFQKGIWLYMSVLIVMASSLFYSLSRGGMLAFVCGLMFFSILILIKGLTKRGYIFLFVILLCTFAMLLWVNAPEQIFKRFSEPYGAGQSLIEKVLGGRRLFADKAFELVERYPLFGVGFGAFEFIYNKRYNPKIMYTDVYYYIDHLHNDFLELFCEAGLLGFAIFSVAGFLYFFFALKTLLKRRDPFAVGIGIGAISGLFSMCVHSLFDFNFHITSNALLFFIIAGLGLVVVNSRMEDDRETTLLARTRPLPASVLSRRVLVSIVLACICLYAAKAVIAPYIAYDISQRKGSEIAYLRKAVRLDPANDRYHFMLAEFFVGKAGADKNKMPEYIKLAQAEVKEAIRLNPWNEYYPVYLDWVNNTYLSGKEPSFSE